MPLQASHLSHASQAPGPLVFSAVKRHKCRAPADFLNQPCLELFLMHYFLLPLRTEVVCSPKLTHVHETEATNA